MTNQLSPEQQKFALELGRASKGDGQRISIDLASLENHFYCLLGKSGAGKSHAIRKLIDQLYGMHVAPKMREGVVSYEKPTFHILGYHQDFEYQYFEDGGANVNVTRESINHLSFDYTDGDTSINILQPLNNSDSLRFRTTEDFVSFCKVVHGGMGMTQQTYIKEILDVIYARFTSKENRAPDITDLYNEIKQIQKSLKTGIAGDVTRKMARLKNERKKINKEIERGDLDTDGKAKAEAELDEIAAQLMDELAVMVKQDTIWVKDEYYAEFDEKTVNTLDFLIASLIRPAFFSRERKVSPKNHMINLYDISILEEKHMNLMTHVLLSRLYHGCALTTRQQFMNPAYANTFIVGDELRYMADAAKDHTSPANLIFGGGRKYGMGMIVGGQGANQLSEDMARAFSIKLILAQNESAYRDTDKFFRIKENMIKQIVAKQSAVLKYGATAELVDLFR